MSDITVTPVAIRPRAAMHFAFTLSMPGRNSWDGRWSGQGRCHVIVRTATSKWLKTEYAKLVGHHSYSFLDGWVAGIDVREVTGEEKRKLVKQSAGFCGYDWMVRSLINHGEIRAT